MVIYESNIAYHVHKELIQYQDCNREMVPTEAGSDISNNKCLNELKSEYLKIELIKIKKILIAMIILLVAVLVVTMLTATTFSILSYRMSKLDDESASRMVHNTIAQSYCGAGQWYRIALLDVSDPSQQCPHPWRDYYNITRVKACGRQVNNSGSCQAILYTTGQQYNKVCGRVSGYQFVSPDAFEGVASNDIDLDGINITHGAQRNHIWSYAAGLTQNYSATIGGHPWDSLKCPDLRRYPHFRGSFVYFSM